MSAISVQAVMRDAASWAALSVRYESAGFDSLLVADHPGARPSPFLALAAAAAVTDRIGLGTNVANIGIRDPSLVASDVATLDVLSNGRARLGLGARHNPAEWASVGRSRPAVSGRVDRFIEAAEAIRELLAGRAVDLDSETTKVRGRLTEPLPVQDLVPLTVGRSNARLLRWAGQHADVVGLTGSAGHFPTAIAMKCVGAAPRSTLK
jgi:alkanesulfonate monooxygenase SsuD/methylene tetrahydromethanopterin reductase-like flavin-dependent oxidoreductase (luciferase family)